MVSVYAELEVRMQGANSSFEFGVDSIDAEDVEFGEGFAIEAISPDKTDISRFLNFVAQRMLTCTRLYYTSTMNILRRLKRAISSWGVSFFSSTT